MKNNSFAMIFFIFLGIELCIISLVLLYVGLILTLLIPLDLILAILLYLLFGSLVSYVNYYTLERWNQNNKLILSFKWYLFLALFWPPFFMLAGHPFLFTGE